MNLVLRLIRIVFHAFFRPKAGFFDKTTVDFRVWVNDLDLNMHMTNSRYLSVMDLGRTDLLIRAGLAHHFWRHNWQAVLGAANLRFRRGLTFFQNIPSILKWWAGMKNGFISNKKSPIRTIW